MNRASVRQGRRAIRRRSDQRMAKPNLRADLQQLLAGRGLRRLPLDAERRRSAPEERGIPDRVGRRQQHQSLRRLRQCGYALSEVVLDMARKGSRAGQHEAAGELSGASTPRQLHQRQRIAARFGDQAVADTIIESAGDDRRQQGTRIAILKSFERQFRQICQLACVARLANREHDRDRFARSRRAMNPRTWDVAASSHCASSTRHSSGRSSATSANKVSAARATRKRSGASPDERPRDTRSAFCWGVRKRVELGEHRCAQAMQSSERQFHLGLDARDLGHLEPNSLPGGVPEECRLANPGLTPNDEDRALARAGGLKQPVKHTRARRIRPRNAGWRWTAIPEA